MTQNEPTQAAKVAYGILPAAAALRPDAARYLQQAASVTDKSVIASAWEGYADHRRRTNEFIDGCQGGVDERGVSPACHPPPEIRMHEMNWIHAVGAPAILQIMLHQPATPLPQTHAVGCAIRQIRYHASQFHVLLPLVMDPWSERVQKQYTQWLAQAHRRDQWTSSEQIVAALVSGMPEVLSFTTPPLAVEPRWQGRGISCGVIFQMRRRAGWRESPQHREDGDA